MPALKNPYVHNAYTKICLRSKSLHSKMPTFIMPTVKNAYVHNAYSQRCLQFKNAYRLSLTTQVLYCAPSRSIAYIQLKIVTYCSQVVELISLVALPNDVFYPGAEQCILAYRLGYALACLKLKIYCFQYTNSSKPYSRTSTFRLDLVLPELFRRRRKNSGGLYQLSFSYGYANLPVRCSYGHSSEAQVMLILTGALMWYHCDYVEDVSFIDGETWSAVRPILA